MKGNHYTLGYYQSFGEYEEPQFRISLADKLSFVPHMHTQIEMIYVLEGNIEVTIDSRCEKVSKGELVLVAPYRIHSFKSDEANQCMVAIFEAQMLPEVEQALKNRMPKNPFFKYKEVQEELEACIEGILYYKDQSKALSLKGYMYILFGILFRYLELEEGKTKDKESLEQILGFIEKNYDKPIMLGDVARGVGYSKYYISYLFNQHIGYKFLEYINFLRVNKAKRLLNTSMKITEIAYECGFESTRSFYRAFDRYCGMTPKKYREI